MSTQTVTSRLQATARMRVSSISPWAAAVWVGVAAYATLLTVETVRVHYAFGSAWDLAHYDQLLWLLSHGEEPFSTVVTRPMLADHFQPALVLLTPVYWLGLGIPGLLAVQSIALALTAPALYVLARSVGASQVLASIPALLWLMCPWVASFNFFDFHPLAFLPPLLVLSVRAVVCERWVLLAATTVLALSLKEDVALTYVLLGFLLALRGARRAGVALALGSALWFVMAYSVVEAFGASNDIYGRRFAGDRGESVGDAVLWMLGHPLGTLNDVFVETLPGLIRLFVSTGGLALLAPIWILLSAPAALHNALSAYGPQHDLVNHYHLGTLTPLFVAAAIGAGRIGALRRRAQCCVLTLGFCAAIMAVGSGLEVHEGLSAEKPPRAAAIHVALDRIPQDAPVAATWSLLAHLSQRIEVYSLPEPFLPVDWGSSLSRSDLAERAGTVRFVAYRDHDILPTGGFYPSPSFAPVKRELRRLGFVEIERVGNVHVLERLGNGR